MPKERRFADRDEATTDGGEQQHRVDERVLMVRCNDERAAGRNVLEAHNVDAPVKQRHQRAR
jgi:hypothetical protein